MPRFKLTLAYNGSAYGGWQYQKPEGGPQLPSVQGTVAGALEKLLVDVPVPPSAIYAAGRTDAGVHATAQVAHVDIEKNLTPENMQDGLNHYLPHTIRILNAEEVPDTFHARHSATWRAYRYVLVQARVLPPHLLGQVGVVRVGQHYGPLNAELMQAELAAVGLGTHDFSALQDAECQSRTPLCHMLHWRVFRHTDALGTPQIIIETAANHFLHHMVRNLVGVLVAVGTGRKPAGELSRVLASKTRTEASITFSPHGLYLWKIGYGEFEL